MSLVAAGRGSGPGALLGVKTWLSHITDCVYLSLSDETLKAVGEVDPTMQSALEMCNLSWTPLSSLEKDN